MYYVVMDSIASVRRRGAWLDARVARCSTLAAAAAACVQGRQARERAAHGRRPSEAGRFWTGHRVFNRNARVPPRNAGARLHACVVRHPSLTHSSMIIPHSSSSADGWRKFVEEEPASSLLHTHPPSRATPVRAYYCVNWFSSLFKINRRRRRARAARRDRSISRPRSSACARAAQRPYWPHCARRKATPYMALRWTCGRRHALRAGPALLAARAAP